MKALLLACALLFTGCSITTVTGSLEDKGTQPIVRIALLPPQADSDISRERIQIVHHLVRSELRSKGFSLIDDTIVRRVCGDSTCKNRSELFKKFGAQAVVSDEIESLQRANFLAGYINTVKGKLVFFDSKGAELYSVQRSQRERGGLLFESGQLLQAAIATAANAKSDESFSVLAELYAKNLVEDVPAPKSALSDSGLSADEKVVIASTEVTNTKDGSDLICAHGTPNLSAFLVYERVRSSLRETSTGTYCGVYKLEDLPAQSKVDVELRSPYGDAARAPLKISSSESCELGDAVKIVSRGKKIELQVACSMSARYSRFLVYRAANANAPFKKVGEFKGRTWTDASAATQETRYAIVAESSRGDLTSPVVVSTSTEDSRASLQ